jgi:hypothetical protein
MDVNKNIAQLATNVGIPPICQMNIDAHPNALSLGLG